MPAWHEPQPGAFSHAPQPLNLSLARLHHIITPDLAVIDGVPGMEGNGPVDGAPVASGVALAGANALAVDIVGSELMGLDYRTIGYLWYPSQLRGMSREGIEAMGEDPARCVTRYRPYEKCPPLLGWWVENWRDYLSGS